MCAADAARMALRQIHCTVLRTSERALESHWLVPLEDDPAIARLVRGLCPGAVVDEAAEAQAPLEFESDDWSPPSESDGDRRLGDDEGTAVASARARQAAFASLTEQGRCLGPHRQ